MGGAASGKASGAKAGEASGEASGAKAGEASGDQAGEASGAKAGEDPNKKYDKLLNNALEKSIELDISYNDVIEYLKAKGLKDDIDLGSEELKTYFEKCSELIGYANLLKN